MKRGFGVLVGLAASALLAKGSTALAQGCVSGRIYAETINNQFLGYASNFNVKFCSDIGGQNCPIRGTADSGGTFNISHSSSGNFYIFAWRDDIYWGSSTAPLSPYTLPIYYPTPAGCQQIAGTLTVRPRPLPPGAISPTSTAQPKPCTTNVTWTSGLDANRVGGTVKYDLYGGGNGVQNLVASNLSAPALTGFLLEPSVPYNWRVVAKLQIFSAITYDTSSPTFYFTTAAFCNTDPLHAPTGLHKEPDPSRNLIWTPPDNLTPADHVAYIITIYGPAPGCDGPDGCTYTAGAPYWYTLGPSKGPGNYSWKLKAVSTGRPSSPEVWSTFTLP